MIEENAKELKDLCNIIRRETDVSNVDPSKYPDYGMELLARRKARQIVEEWVTEAFKEKYPFKIEPEEDDNLYNRLDRNLRLGEDGT